MAGCALGALVAATSGRARTPVLALAEPVGRGEVIEDADLEVTYVGADAPVAHVNDEDRSTVVGQAALVDLPVGTIVTPAQYGEPAAVTADGDGTVGLTLEPGQLPALPLVIGDEVRVVGGPGPQGSEAPAGRLADAQVVATDRLDDSSGSWWVSLRAAEADAMALASAAASGARVHLVLVGR